MTKRLVIALAALAAVFALMAAPAAAQDGPGISVDPSSVDAAGEHTFTVTGTGFTVDSVFVLPCVATDDPSSLDAQGGDCDLGNLTPAPIVDGGFTVEVTYTVPEEGMSIVAGDAGQTEAGFVNITVGAAAEEAPAEEAPAEDELAVTGVESGLLAVIAAAVLAGGFMMINTTRRQREI